MAPVTDLQLDDHENAFEQGEFIRLPSGEIVLYQDKAHPPAPDDRAWHLPPGTPPPRTKNLSSVADMWTADMVQNGWEGGLVAPHGRAMEVEDFVRPAAIGVIHGIITKLRANEIPVMTLEIRNAVCHMLEQLAAQVAAPQAATGQSDPMCPRCSNRSDIRIKESYTAHHPVRGVKSGQLQVENALRTSSPSEWFDEGAGDYVACCGNCGHTGPIPTFGIDDPQGWSWL